ncbi:DUF4437 domain-containing protein [Flammeovirga pacifica]|uniref:DUF4437 domain-containing protein n=1 Tax=Flammeovirga pacifica TaxID=915059 RepID=A0A1S1YU54_FLAPC|nr:DUF4437 domain-containing protein [Flammeovirga pacifica]OHX64562.1 hypothetical protein NH26_23605 [Flammeovirga pacifica]
MKIIISLLVVACFVLSCQEEQKEEKEQEVSRLEIDNSTNKVGLSKDIKFIPLNPARGDKAPQAGAIYGNIRKDVATGYIGKFKNGFSSPPHIHNITYRAIVMNGELHNADEKAPKMWMTTGSIWTQPKGQSHITAAQGENAMAYIEIDSGPYLVKHEGEAFESDEKPINMHASNVIYLGKSESKLIGENCDAKIAYVWEKKNGENGYLLKLPTGFKGNVYSEGSIFFGIIISGKVAYTMPDSGKIIGLDQGSHFESKTKAIHDISTNEESLVYIRTNARFMIE